MLTLQIEDLRFRYPTERFELAIPRLTIPEQEATGMIGPSGCGKTTLLKLIAGILRPNAGSVRVLDQEVSALAEVAARRFRLCNIGLVFQEFELLEYLTVTENILLPYRISGALQFASETRDRLTQLAADTGIAHLLAAYPRAISQGERQRVAICRALITQPKLILADEPTGSLDPENQRRIVELLRRSAEAAAAGLIMVTHDHGLLEPFDRVIDIAELLGAQT